MFLRGKYINGRGKYVFFSLIYVSLLPIHIFSREKYVFPSSVHLMAALPEEPLFSLYEDRL